MCHGITASGKACGRNTVEWCHQHIEQKPIVAEPIVAEPIVAEPIVAERVDADLEEKAEAVILDETLDGEVIGKKNESDFVQLNITEPTEMAPQVTDIELTAVSATIVAPNKATKRVSFKTEKGYHFDKFKQLNGGYINDTYISISHINCPHFKIERPKKVSIGNEVVRVEFCARVDLPNPVKSNGKECAFYWFIEADEMLKWTSLMCAKYNDVEIHQVNWEGTCSFFVDLDWEINADSFDEWFADIDDANENASDAICGAITNATKHTCDDINKLRMSVSQRSRKLTNGNTKISLHVYTNIAMLFYPEANKFTDNVKKDLKSTYSDEWVKSMSSGFDDAQYHTNGSLALPYGTKNGVQSTMLTKDIKPLINAVSDGPSYSGTTAMNKFNFDYEYEEPTDEPSSSYTVSDNDDELIKEVIKYKHKISDSEAHHFTNYRVFEIKGNTNYIGLRLNRKHTSLCPMCNTHHDSDNTMMIVINKVKRYATWKCVRPELGHKPIRFYTYKEPKSSKKAEKLKIDEAKPKVEEAKPVYKTYREADEQAVDFMMEVCKIVHILPDNLIREHNDIEFNDLLMNTDALTAEEVALYIKRTVIHTENNGEPILFVKTITERKYKREVVKSVKYEPRNIRSLKDYRVLVDSGRDGILRIKLDKLMKFVKPDINYKKVVVEPYGALEKDSSIRRRNFNLFAGFLHQYDPEFKVDENIVKVWTEHIRHVISGDDEAVYTHLLRAFKHILVNPMDKTGLVIVVKGKQGSGKNSAFDVYYRYVVGPQVSLTTPNMGLITGRFNSIRQSLLCCCLDEAVDNSDRAAMNQFKNLSTADEVQIENKGKDPFKVGDFANYVVISNNDFASFIEESDRRSICLETINDKIGDRAYFSKFWKTLGNVEAGKHIFHWLINEVDIPDDCHPQDVPATKYKQELKQAQACSTVKFLLHRLESLIDADDHQEHKDTPTIMWNWYVSFCENNKHKAVSNSAFMKILQSYIPTSKSGGIKYKRYAVDTLKKSLSAYLVD